jgi:hypothetical protein
VCGGELGARGVEVRTRREPAEKLRHPMHTARHHRCRQVMRACDDVGDDLGLGRIRHRGFQHTHDGRGAIAQPHSFSEHRRVAVERRRPEAVCQHRRARRLRAVIGGPEQPAAHGAEAHDAEIGAVHDARAHDAWLAEADHGELDRGEFAESVQRLYARAQVFDLGYREDRVLHARARCGVSDVDETILVLIDQRPQKDAAHHAEDGGVGADAKGQRHDYRNGQALDAEQRPQRKPEVHRLVSCDLDLLSGVLRGLFVDSLFGFPQFGCELGAEVVGLEDLPDFDFRFLAGERIGRAPDPINCLLLRLHLEDPEAGD